MATKQATMTRERNDQVAYEPTYESWTGWPVYWSAVWVGALAALAVVLIIGLIGIAVGAHLLGPEDRIVDLKRTGILALIFSVCGAFFAFVAGGWTAGKVAGIRRSEPAMLHGAIVWLTALPVLLVLAGLGAGSFFGGWYGGLSGSPRWTGSAGTPFDQPVVPGAGASQKEQDDYRKELVAYRENVKQWKEETPAAVRNSALGAVTALLLGLVGAVVGGWLASGEPMSFTHYRTRNNVAPRMT